MMQESTLDRLAARRFGYLLFQRLLGTSPADELFEAVDLGVAREALALMFGEAGEAAARGAELLERLEAARGDAASLRDDYTRLFEGPAALPAPPWESVYLSNRRLVMQPSTLEVRAAYRAQGFLPAQYPHVPDDHIALELDFLAEVAGRALEAAEDGDAARCDDLLEASASFVAEHLGRWVDAFAQDMAEKGRCDYYGDVARALAAFVAADAAMLEGMRGTEHDHAECGDQS